MLKKRNKKAQVIIKCNTRAANYACKGLFAKIRTRRVRIGDGRTDPDWAKRGMENILVKKILQLQFESISQNLTPVSALILKYNK